MALERRHHCALCSSTDLDLVLSLPPTPLANEFVASPEEAQSVYPLDLALCQACGHLQILTLIDSATLFRDYVYVTGTSPATVAHFAAQAAEIDERFKISTRSQPFVVEIGSNDGTALHAWRKRGAIVLGIDPAKRIAAAATKSGILTIADFFNADLAEKIVSARGAADVVLANNVFAHAADLQELICGAAKLVGRNGILVLEVAYVRDITDHLAFDTIYHEHFSYHALRPLVRALSRWGLKVIDAHWNAAQMGRGSLRVYAANRDAQHESSAAVGAMIAAEEAVGVFARATYTRLAARISDHGQRLCSRLDALLDDGTPLYGYGAAAKLTTFMYAFGLGERHAQFIVDDSPWKQGLFTPGLHIPVVAPEDLVGAPPGACVIYAWNFADSIMKKHIEYPGRFIVPLPEYREIVPTEHRMWT